MDKKALDLRDMLRDTIIVSLVIVTLISIPVINRITMIFVPLPIIYCLARTGRQSGLILLGLALILVYLAMNFLGTVFFFPAVFLLATLGVIISELLKKNLKIELMIVTAAAIFLLAAAITLVYLGAGEDLSFIDLLKNYLSLYIKASLETVSQLNLNEEQLAALRDSTREIVETFLLIFPALVLVSTVFTVLANLMGALFVFEKTKMSRPDYGDLSRWRPPEKLVWLLIGSGALILFPWDGGKVLGLNALIIVIFIYLLAGLAVAEHLLSKLNISEYFRYILYLFIFIEQFLLIIFVALGLIDIWVNFRKPKEENISGS